MAQTVNFNTTLSPVPHNSIMHVFAVSKTHGVSTSREECWGSAAEWTSRHVPSSWTHPSADNTMRTEGVAGLGLEKNTIRVEGVVGLGLETNTM